MGRRNNSIEFSIQMIGSFLMIVVFASLAPGTAMADWQYARWGMSKNEVVSASKGIAKVPDNPDQFEDNEYSHLLSAPYKSEDFSFDAKFYFNKQYKLSEVRLKLRDLSECNSLRVILKNTYGTTQDASVTRGVLEIMKWRDKQNKNIVIFTQIEGRWCSIDYQPLKKAGAKNGL
jgi:hypothetical protein